MERLDAQPAMIADRRAQLLEGAIANVREALREKNQRFRGVMDAVRPDLAGALTEPRNAEERIIAELVRLFDTLTSEIDEVVLVLELKCGTA